MSYESNAATENTLMWTIAAIVVGFLLVIPFYFVGGLAVVAYMIFDRIGASAYEHSLFPFMTGIAVFLFQILIPEIIRGGTAGYLTILVNHKIFKKAKKESVLVGILCGWLPIMAFVAFYHYTKEGVDKGLLDIAVNTIAFCVAMIWTHLSLAD